MKVNVLGVQQVDYISKKSGNPVKGTTLHCSFADPQTKGLAVDSIFVSDNLGLDFVATIKAGDVVDIMYNNRGYVNDVVLVK